MPAPLSAELEPLAQGQRAELEAEWSALEAGSEASMFQSWSWIDAWLEALPQTAELHRLRVWSGAELVGLGLFGKAAQTRHKLIRSRMLWLSEAGDPALDALTVEHNDLLIARGWEARVWPAALDALMRQRQAWDEIRISGISRPDSRAAILRHAQATGLEARTEFSKPYFWVDLAGMPPDRGAYLDVLSRNTRQQIRRAMKLYQENGPLAVSLAGSEEEALCYLDELTRLHQAYWNGKGRAGAFATDFANRFHRRLVANGFARRQIQLLKVTAGTETVGILYNLLHRRRACNYQAGLVYGADPKLKPGLVCHTLAIEANIALGHESYDFLMGESQYKRSLSTRAGLMYWLTLRQPRLRFRVERAAQQARDGLRGIVRARGEPS